MVERISQGTREELDSPATRLLPVCRLSVNLSHPSVACLLTCLTCLPPVAMATQCSVTPDRPDRCLWSVLDGAPQTGSPHGAVFNNELSVKAQQRKSVMSVLSGSTDRKLHTSPKLNNGRPFTGHSPGLLVKH